VPRDRKQQLNNQSLFLNKTLSLLMGRNSRL